MSSFHLGNMDIPIYTHVDLTGEPTQYPNRNLETLIGTLQPADMFFNNSVKIGEGSAPTNYQHPEAQGSTFSIIQGGRTGIHGAEVVFSENVRPDPANAGPWRDGIVNVTMVVEEQTISLQQSQITIIETCSPAYQGKIAEYHAFAISYAFPEAAAEKDRVKGYAIYTVKQIVYVQPSGQVYSTVFGIDTGSIGMVNIPYYNKTRDLSLYYDEAPGPEPEEPPFDPSDSNPYAPTLDDTSDLIDLPSDPTIGVTNAGFINVYNPSAGALQGLGDILFPNVASATDIVDAVIKLCETLANQNLINYVIDCHVIPAAPVVGNNSNIKVGFRDTGISVPVVTSDYCNISCGSLNIAEYFGGFADYMATRSKIYLPFIGFVDTKPEYWQSGTISVDYKFNIIDGSFMAYIRSVSSKSQLAGSVIAQYAGNACMHFPMTGVNYSNMVSGLVGAAITAASAGSSTAVLGSALSAANTIAQGGNVQQSNAYNSTAAILGVRTPYLLIERAVPSYSSKYMHDSGYPSNIYANLANVTGYTEIEDIDLSGIPLTQTELEELRGLLKEGVYF